MVTLMYCIMQNITKQHYFEKMGTEKKEKNKWFL